MSITFRQLEAFSLSAKDSSFSRAAKALDMSPPAITKHIRNLEKEVGFKLFEQIGRQIYITPSAKELLPQVTQIHREIQRLYEIIHTVNQSQYIRLAISHTFENVIFNKMQAFRRGQPKVDFDVQLAGPAHQYKLLHENECDFGILSESFDDGEFHNVKIKTIDFVLVAHQQHPLARENKIDPKTLNGHTLIMPRRELQTMKNLNQFLEKYHLPSYQMLQLNSYVAIKDAIIAQLGVGILPTSLIEDDISKQCLTVLNNSQFKYDTTLYCIYRKSKKLTDVTKSFIEHLKT